MSNCRAFIKTVSNESARSSVIIVFPTTVGYCKVKMSEKCKVHSIKVPFAPEIPLCVTHYSINTPPVTIFTIVWVFHTPRPIPSPQFFSKYIYESMCLPKPTPGSGCSWLSGLLACWPRGCITILYGYINLWEAPRGSLTEREDLSSARERSSWGRLRPWIYL